MIIGILPYIPSCTAELTCFTDFDSPEQVSADDERARRAGLPPVDSIDQWNYLSGRVSDPPRSSVHISETALIQGRLKLLTGNVKSACWGGPVYPNATTAANPTYGSYHSPCNTTLRCGQSGCLFDVVEDFEERIDLALDPLYTTTVRVRVDIIRHARTKYVGKSQSRKV